MAEFEISDKTVIKMGSADAPLVLVDVTDYFKTLKTSEQIDNEDITTLGTVEQRAKILAYLLNSQTFTADILWDGPFWQKCGKIGKQAKKVAFEVYPKGEVVGQEKWALTILLGNRDRNLSTGEVDKGTLAITRSGPAAETIIA